MQQPRRGDRSRPNDDRYLFLETLLSAREKFYLSYVGKDVRDNTDKAPATVITEMLAYLNASYQRSGAPDQNVVTVLQHPLQPFSKRYFDQSDEYLKNYKPLWFQSASTQPHARPFIDTTESRAYPGSTESSSLVLEDPSKHVRLVQLIQFFTRPSVSYLQERLQVSEFYTPDDLQNTEQFDLNGLERWQVDQSVLELSLIHISEPTRPY